MILFESDSTSASFYFAAEEYIMRTLRPREAVLMLWSTNDTIMIGANQIAGAECDLACAKSAGIVIVRRPSGGGAIFTDKGTLQYTVILPNENKWIGQNNTDTMDVKAVVREWLAEPLIRTLARYGAHASLSGRNDVVIGGKKISGTAQHITAGYICSHGSLLFCADMKKLAKTLTVDREKITSKAIASVSARVTNIADHIKEKDIRRFREAFIESYEQIINGNGSTTKENDPTLKENDPITMANDPKTKEDISISTEDGSISTGNELAAKEYGPLPEGGINQKHISARPDNPRAITRRRFRPDELARIESIKRERYDNPEWTIGREPAFTFSNKKRFPGGLIEVFLDIKGGVIKNAKINGDFLALRPISSLEAGLKGVPHREEALREALRSLDASSVLGSLSERELLETLL